MPTLHQIDEEGYFIHLGRCLLTSIRENQAVPQHPPVLTALASGKPFLIYIRAMDHSLRALLAQNNNQGHEQAIYYLSRIMIGVEHRYNSIEKNARHCYSPSRRRDTTWWTKPIHHIKSQSFKIAHDEAITLNGRLAKWAILLSQYEIQFLPQKAVKG